MADENITDVQRQLSAAMLQVQNDLAQFGRVTQQSADQLKDAQMKAKYGSESFTKGANTAAQALGALAGAGIESTKAMYEGKKGAGAFNSSLDEMSKAAVLAGTALTLLLPGGIVMKAVIGGLTMAATAAIAYTKAANDMADKLYQGYSKLQESGAAASDGMTGVFNDAKKLGLSMNQLDSYVSLVAANSQELALMSGSVAQGRKEFAKVGEALESSRVGFFKMGITQEQQNEALMRYTKNQTLAGRAQNMTSKEMADGARAYIYEQDKLTKLTGMSAQKQQALLDKARENEQFNAKLRSLEIKGDKESLAAAERLKQGLVVASQAGIEEAFMASVNGNLRSAEAQKANISTFGELGRYARDLEAGTVQAVGGFKRVTSAGADYEKTIGIQRSMLDSGTESQLKTSQMQKLALLDQMDQAAIEKKIAADQLKQQQGSGDAVANQYGSLIKTQQDINKKLEQDVFKGIPNALANMQKLTGVTDKLADGFTHLTNGINRLLKLVGLGEKEAPVAKQTTTGERAAMAATQGARDAAKPLQERVDQLNKEITQDEKKLKDAKRAGRYGEEEKKLEEKILANKKEYEEESNKLVEAEKKISQLGKEEHQLRVKQQADRQTLHKLENQNLKDTEEIKVQNEKKINAQKAGDAKGVASAEAEIKNRQSSIQGRSEQVSKLQTDLKTSAVSSGGTNPTSTAALADAGIKMKKGDVQKEGADLSPNIIELAKNIQENIKGFGYFSGFNDNFHQEKASSSKHTKGLAADFTLDKKPTPEQGQELVTYLNKQGASLAIDEYNSPSAKATGGHIHVEIPTFAEGGNLEAGKLGIAGEAGPEFVEGPASITPMGDIMGVFNNMAMMMGQQVGAIDELIRITKNSNDIQTKILRVQQ